MQMLRFTDDVAMLADSEENLKGMLPNLECFDKTVKQEYNMKINMTKTKILVCSRQYIKSNIRINNITLERVNNFTYLGSKVTSDRKSTTDINCKIAQTKQPFFKKKNYSSKKR